MEEYVIKMYIDLIIVILIGKILMIKFRNININGIYMVILIKREMYGYGKGVKSSFFLCLNSV